MNDYICHISMVLKSKIQLLKGVKNVLACIL